MVNINSLKGLFLSAASVMLLLSVSCGGDGDEDAPIMIETSDLLASNPDWAITAFIDNGTDRTGDFQNYTFEVFSNGDFLINFNGLNDSFGGWEIAGDNMVLDISISNPKDPTDEIDGEWNVLSKSSNSLRLVSADGAGKEFRLRK